MLPPLIDEDCEEYEDGSEEESEGEENGEEEDEGQGQCTEPKAEQAAKKLRRYKNTTFECVISLQFVSHFIHLTSVSSFSAGSTVVTHSKQLMSKCE